jgi:uncharacterized protein YqgV (UPF0045/DUF77 family)
MKTNSIEMVSLSISDDHYGNDEIVHIMVTESEGSNEECKLDANEIQNRCEKFDTNSKDGIKLYTVGLREDNSASTQENGLLEPLRNKVMLCYTEYVNKCISILNRIEFEEQYPEKEIKIENDTDGILQIFIEASEILSRSQIRRFCCLLETYSRCQFLVSELICSVGSDFRDELLACVYYILEELSSLISEHREEYILNSTLEISNAIILKISSEIRIVHLTFALYNDRC